MASFSNDGIEIHYEDTGIQKPAVVFSHGFLMDREMFDPQVYALSGDFRCITWDERAHGHTKAAGPFSYWDSAEDVLALLDHLDIDRAFLIGMSQGGFVSMRAALTAPERVRGLVFIDSQAGLEDEHLKGGYDDLFETWASEGTTPEIAEAVSAVILGPGVPAESWVEKWRNLDGDQVRLAYETLMGRDDLWDRLGEIEAPALVIHGTADMAISMDKAERLAQSLPGCEGLVLVPEAGHASNLGDPETVTSAIRDFLTRHV